jgi:nicotinamide-nucleotide amidase
MQIEIVTIGNEVLSGRTLDTNFAFLAKALERVGVQVAWHSTVGDSAERIAEGLRRALERADAVVMTGGLGPTPDDVTRSAVASLLGRPLAMNEDVLASIRARARSMNRTLTPSAEAQAMLPGDAEAWSNRLGTAPGILLLHEDKPVILLPGVPQEVEGLATEFLVPYLRDRTGLHVETFTLRTAGVYETLLQERIGDIPAGWVGASLAYLPGFQGVDLRVTTTGSNAARVSEVSARAYLQLRRCVAPVLYAEGDRTIEEVVGEALLQRKFRLASAESCTGGLLAKRMTDVAGSSRYFERGYVTYSNTAKIENLHVRADDIEAHGAVSAVVAAAMAAGVRDVARTQMGVSITGIAGPDGGSPAKPVGTVFAAVSSPRGESVRELHIIGTRRAVRERSTQAALDMVRRELADLPLEPRLE